MPTLDNLPIFPFLLAVALSGHGLRKKSLSPSGALAAFIVGFLMMSRQLRTFGVSLIVFYFIGSRATKVGKSLKTKYEEGHAEAGYRTAFQVLCNSFTALIASVVWSALFTKDSTFSTVLSPFVPIKTVPYDSTQWCALSGEPGANWSRFLLFLNLGHFACCLGDTLASELGILSKSPPILITTLKPVPPGTNGAMSLTGTLASVAGGAIMGVTMVISLLLENSSCRESSISILMQLVLWGALAGGFGSLLDSFMGATIQATRYNTEKKLILQDETRVDSNAKDVKVISGINILTNNQVNLLSSFLTAILIASIA